MNESALGDVFYVRVVMLGNGFVVHYPRGEGQYCATTDEAFAYAHTLMGVHLDMRKKMLERLDSRGLLPKPDSARAADDEDGETLAAMMGLSLKDAKKVLRRVWSDIAEGLAEEDRWKEPDP